LASDAPKRRLLLVAGLLLGLWAVPIPALAGRGQRTAEQTLRLLSPFGLPGAGGNQRLEPTAIDPARVTRRTDTFRFSPDASVRLLAESVPVLPTAARDDDALLVPESDDEPLPPPPPIRPPQLRDPELHVPELQPLPALAEPDSLLQWEGDAPLGFTGPSGVLPQEAQTSSHFVPVEDRWRVGFPRWDRYGAGHPPVDDYPYVEGTIWDPYNQNVLKGDYPLIGQHTFLRLTGQSATLLEARQVPTPTTPFESTRDPGQAAFFGDPDQYAFNQNFVLSVDLFHGDAAFKPNDWRVKITPIFNANHLVADELAIVNPDVLAGTSRFRQDFALEEWFLEAKLADLSSNYDFISARAGSQPFVSDFRGFIFSDVNRGVRLFGTRASNRDQFNIVFFDQTEKETNSLLNTYDDRHQNTLIANYYRQDFIWPGFTSQFSFHYNHDRPTVEFDTNNFLVRPDPVGIFQPHDIKSYYVGWTGNGHINRINVSHALYHVFGVDDLNPLAGQRQDIRAWMAALELSYDRDWVRFRTSYFHSSGDPDIFDNLAEGFDAIFDNPAFAGGEFSYWQRQAVRLFGVNLVNRMSLVPNLRSSKFQGQTNFVNPGLHLFNLGMDADLTPKLKLIHNTNFLWFEHTEILERYVFQDDIDDFIGTDVSLGAEYRPLLNNNVIFVGGIAGLLVGEGFEDLFSNLEGDVDDLFAGFVNCILEY
jgi:hypothetical protein